jgi:hypothetical protein
VRGFDDEPDTEDETGGSDDEPETEDETGESDDEGETHKMEEVLHSEQKHEVIEVSDVSDVEVEFESRREVVVPSDPEEEGQPHRSWQALGVQGAHKDTVSGLSGDRPNRNVWNKHSFPPAVLPDAAPQESLLPMRKRTSWSLHISCSMTTRTPQRSTKTGRRLCISSQGNFS